MKSSCRQVECGARQGGGKPRRFRDAQELHGSNLAANGMDPAKVADPGDQPPGGEVVAADVSQADFAIRNGLAVIRARYRAVPATAISRCR